MLNEFMWATGGAVGGIGASAMIFRFLNAKINKVDETKAKKIEKLDEKKQDITMCNDRFLALKEGLQRVENKIDIGVMIAKDDLQRVVTKLDSGTQIQSDIQKEILLMANTMKKYNGEK